MPVPAQCVQDYSAGGQQMEAEWSVLNGAVQLAAAGPSVYLCEIAYVKRVLLASQPTTVTGI